MTAKYQHDDIARIAYRSWLDRGQPEGSPEVDWYYALSVVTNPEEIRPVPFGSFDSGDAEQKLVQSGDSRSHDEQALDEQDSLQPARNNGMQDEGMRNDTDAASDDSNEVTRRSDQFSVDQKATQTSRSRKKSVDSREGRVEGKSRRAT